MQPPDAPPWQPPSTPTPTTVIVQTTQPSLTMPTLPETTAADLTEPPFTNATEDNSRNVSEWLTNNNTANANSPGGSLATDVTTTMTTPDQVPGVAPDTTTQEQEPQDPDTNGNDSNIKEDETNRHDFPLPGALIPLTAQQEQAIKNDYIAYMRERSLIGLAEFPFWFEINPDDLHVWYFGTYSGHDVVVFGIPDVEYFDNEHILQVAGYDIIFAATGYELLVRIDSAFVPILAAYEQNHLKQQDIFYVKVRTNPWEFEE
jgi:hypothetical protein